MLQHVSVIVLTHSECIGETFFLKLCHSSYRALQSATNEYKLIDARGDNKHY